MRLAQRLATRLITSDALRDTRRRLARLRRRGGRRADFYWDVADPYAALALPYLARLAERHALAVRVLLVPPPGAAAAPEATRLAAYARADARRVATALGQPEIAPDAPSPEQLDAAERTACAALTEGVPLARLAALAQAIAAGGPLPGPAATAAQVAAARAEGAARRAEAGHYLGSVTSFEGEHYWGVDRLHYLAARLAAETGEPPAPCPLLDAQLPGAPSATGEGPTLNVFLSLRSPYSLIAAERIGALAAHYGATLRLRFVLPMVMRGLPVPAAKRLYISLDTKREAARHGIAFGTIVDPVGLGVECGLAVLHAADQAGRGLDFARAFLRAAFARGIDMTGTGLFRVAASVGLDRDFVEAALADQSWRAVAEANRAALFHLGLWGVPSFQVAGRPGHWGQDRLWAVEDDLRAALGLAPIDRRMPCVA